MYYDDNNTTNVNKKDRRSVWLTKNKYIDCIKMNRAK